jgi:hypothetical protein
MSYSYELEYDYRGRVNLTEFNETAEKLVTGIISQQNFELISKLIDEFHAVRAAVRVIETKRNDFW